MSEKRVQSLALALLGTLILASDRATAQQSTKPGYVAEITDTTGTKLTVSGLSLGYTYSYWRSNCIGACGASSDSTIQALPLNEGCGATMVPLSSVKSIGGIARVSGKEGYQATVTLGDGRQMKTQIGSFGGETLQRVTGASALGDYSLPLDKVAQIMFLHDRDVLPLPKAEWGSDEPKATGSVTCSDGSTYSLSKVALYSVGDAGTNTRYAEKTLSVKVGESEIKMEFDRIRSLNRSGEKLELTTSGGETIAVVFTGEDRYIGGQRDGLFYYVSLRDLKSVAVGR